MKTKEEKLSLMIQHLGTWKDLVINVYADASFATADNNLETKSVMGYYIAISNENKSMNPLHWKSKIIEKVAEDTKTAETLALENAIDDALYLSSMISEIYTGEKNKQEIPLVLHTDSKSLLESIFSTRKVKRKTMRVVVSSMQQKIKEGKIKDVFHIGSKEQIADILTKKGVSNHLLLETLKTGSFKTPEDLQNGQSHEYNINTC